MGEGHGLDLVVGHVDGGHPQLVLHVLELGAHVAAELRVEVREGFVHQERGGPAHDRPRECDALPLPPRELARITLEQILHVDLGGRVAHRRRSLVRFQPPHLERKPDVLRDRLVGIERVGLEHHRDVAVLRELVRDVRVAEDHLPGVRLLEARDDPERRGLAAPGRPEQHQELARLDVDAQVLHHVVRAEPLVEPPDRQPPRAGLRMGAGRRRPVSGRCRELAHPSSIPRQWSACLFTVRAPACRSPLIPSPLRAGSPSR